MLEQRMLAFALAYPGCGPLRISSELRRPKWGGLQLSANGVWRVLRRHWLQTRAKRLGLVAGDAAPPEPEHRPRPEPRHLASSYAWAELYKSPKNPDAHWTSHLAEVVAEDLARRGWRLETVTTDNPQEFRSQEFEQALARLKARQIFIRAGRTAEQRLCREQVFRIRSCRCCGSGSRRGEGRDPAHYLRFRDLADFEPVVSRIGPKV